jgi:predicted heme/steroid binding protein
MHADAEHVKESIAEILEEATTYNGEVRLFEQVVLDDNGTLFVVDDGIVYKVSVTYYRRDG